MEPEKSRACPIPLRTNLEMTYITFLHIHWSELSQIALTNQKGDWEMCSWSSSHGPREIPFPWRKDRWILGGNWLSLPQGQAEFTFSCSYPMSTQCPMCFLPFTPSAYPMAYYKPIDSIVVYMNEYVNEWMRECESEVKEREGLGNRRAVISMAPS